LRQPFEYTRIHIRSDRPLLGEAHDVFFQVRISGALFEMRQVIDLFGRQSGLLTEGLVIVQSVVAIVNLRGFQIGEFPEFRIEIGTDSLAHAENRLQDLGSMPQRPVNVGH
jgi:hypothetical protein